MNKIVIILDNIRSIYNVGSIFRTADGAGVAQIALCGFTPTPELVAQIAKTALGAEKTVDWKYFEHTKAAVEFYRNQDFEIVSIEQHKRSINYKSYVPTKNNIAIILGHEITGVSTDIIDISDYVLEIKMRGIKNSLNVSNACAIITFYLSDL